LQSAEFDRFADHYLADHANNLRVTGEDPEYFARYKVIELRRHWTRRGFPEPAAILDLGSGIGATLPHLATAFPEADLTAFDVSFRSLAIAERRFPGIARFVHGESVAVLDLRSFDLVFTSCVFHHIEEAEHVPLFRMIRDLLRSDGRFVVFEHNPTNPVTRYIVATCPFDQNAVLIPARVLRARQQQAGFSCIETRYTGFFPNALATLRRVEPSLHALPFGAQYYTVAHA
jgi:SAM-dependent methyltransferase